MKRVEARKYIQEKIIKLFARRGICISIGELKFSGLNKLCLIRVILTSPNFKLQFLEITSIVLHISAWKSILNIALVGEMQLTGIYGKIDFVSEKHFVADKVIFTFKIQNQTKLACMDLGGISLFFQNISKKQTSDIYIELRDIEWNDLINLLQDHLMSDMLKKSYSEDKLSVYCYQQKKREKNSITFFDASIKNNGFSLYHKNFPLQKEKEFRVDNFYLRKTLMERISKDQTRNYVPYESISKNLINAVICTEDPDFWYHHGISPGYIGYALQKNIEQKKIARGASTITMQLVRNLFLSQNRTLTRKVEESIISLLLENYYRISKETIIELYLNIIEFAPNVYGIDEASTYYFGKNILKLSLTEILTLTYIIPRPIYFDEALRDKTHQLRINLNHHLKTYAKIMRDKELISVIKQKEIETKIIFAPVFGILDFNVSN